MTMIKLFFISLIILLSFQMLPQSKADWETVFEKSGFISTADYEQTMNYFQNMADHLEYAEFLSLGITPLGASTLVRILSTQAELLNPALPKVVLDRQGNCIYFSRTPVPFLRDTPQGRWLEHHTFYRHIGVYAFRRACLLRFASYPQTPLESAEKLEQLRLLEHGERIRAVITTYESTGVDTASDLERVRAQAGTHHG